jgi:hypothetical protein
MVKLLVRLIHYRQQNYLLYNRSCYAYEDDLSLFSCKKDFVDIELAKEHSKSLHHELAEETKRARDDSQSLLM